jgi:hypothetical protein
MAAGERDHIRGRALDTSKVRIEHKLCVVVLIAAATQLLRLREFSWLIGATRRMRDEVQKIGE